MVSDFLFISPRAVSLRVLAQKPEMFDTKFVGLCFSKGPAPKLDTSSACVFIKTEISS
jgi:hypothetical protein